MLLVPPPIISRSVGVTCGRPSTWPTSCPSVHSLAIEATTAAGWLAGCAAQPLKLGLVERTKYATTSLVPAPLRLAINCVCSAVTLPIVQVPTSRSFSNGRFSVWSLTRCTRMPKVA